MKLFHGEELNCGDEFELSSEEFTVLLRMIRSEMQREANLAESCRPKTDAELVVFEESRQQSINSDKLTWCGA